MIEITNATPLLSGHRVLDLSSSMGSFCGKVLRDLGMDVIKIEPPGGDAGRLEPPFAKGHAHREGSLRFAYLNGGKKSITLDIAKDSGRKIFLDLVAKSDVVLETFAPGEFAARGLGFGLRATFRP
jgi:benzylsuccinate CoA-transferase BbsE subunit